jgi:hypothetical protein
MARILAVAYRVLLSLLAVLLLSGCPGSRGAPAAGEVVLDAADALPDPGIETDTAPDTPDAPPDLADVPDAREPDIAVDLAPPLPCLSVEPAGLDLVQTEAGVAAKEAFWIVICGDAPVPVVSIVVQEGTSMFTVSLPDGVELPSPLDPLFLAPGAKLPVQVSYLPDAANSVAPDGSPVPHTGLVEVVAGSPPHTFPVTLSGVSEASFTCPIAIIQCAQSGTVPPLSLLELSAKASFSPSGSIVQYLWSVEQPPGSQFKFAPDEQTAEPTFEVNVAGTYVFHLAVVDDAGSLSCWPASFTVQVVPTQSLYVELTWDTPGDPDQTDTGEGTGADLDLHLAHPLAASMPDLDCDGQPDPWFDQVFDCYWFNTHPGWGAYDASLLDDPLLVRDDPDGAGPEIISIQTAEEAGYRIGVHYWAGYGFGPSHPTVRVYLSGTLAYETPPLELVAGDMWTVGTFDGKNDQVIPASDDGPLIHPCYLNPYFMQEADCTSVPCGQPE